MRAHINGPTFIPKVAFSIKCCHCLSQKVDFFIVFELFGFVGFLFEIYAFRAQKSTLVLDVQAFFQNLIWLFTHFTFGKWLASRIAIKHLLIEKRTFLLLCAEKGKSSNTGLMHVCARKTSWYSGKKDSGCFSKCNYSKTKRP